MSEEFVLRPGTAPLLISVPHAGTKLPPGMRERLTPSAGALPDTDWYVDALYEFAAELGIGMIRANMSRYVIDLNRSPDGTALYPGRAETSLCPTELFNGEPVYRRGCEPTPEEVEERKAQYWQPYHERLRGELDRLQAMHETVVLWDAHSIRSYVPRLFEGKLPDLNFGSGGGSSCDPEIMSALFESARADSRFDCVLNGRFKGGYITRHYGAPDNGLHAVQLEIAQSAYMDESAARFEPEQAQTLAGLLERLLRLALDLAGYRSATN